MITHKNNQACRRASSLATTTGSLKSSCSTRQGYWKLVPFLWIITTLTVCLQNYKVEDGHSKGVGGREDNMKSSNCNSSILNMKYLRSWFRRIPPLLEGRTRTLAPPRVCCCDWRTEQSPTLSTRWGSPVSGTCIAEVVGATTLLRNSCVRESVRCWWRRALWPPPWSLLCSGSSGSWSTPLTSSSSAADQASCLLLACITLKR